MAKILIFDEYPSIRNLLAEELAGEGNVILSIGRAELLRDGIATFNPDLAILDLFLRGRIGFLDIPRLVHQAMERHTSNPSPSLEEIYAVDAEARLAATELASHFPC